MEVARVSKHTALSNTYPDWFDFTSGCQASHRRNQYVLNLSYQQMNDTVCKQYSITFKK